MTLFSEYHAKAKTKDYSGDEFLTITGENNLKTAVVTSYCPCKGISTGSVYSQRLLYMSENKSTYPGNIIFP